MMSQRWQSIGLLGGLHIGRLIQTSYTNKEKYGKHQYFITVIQLHHGSIVLRYSIDYFIRIQDLYWIGVVLQYLNDPSIVDNVHCTLPLGKWFRPLTRCLRLPTVVSINIFHELRSARARLEYQLTYIGSG